MRSNRNLNHSIIKKRTPISPNAIEQRHQNTNKSALCLAYWACSGKSSTKSGALC